MAKLQCSIDNNKMTWENGGQYQIDGWGISAQGEKMKLVLKADGVVVPCEICAVDRPDVQHSLNLASQNIDVGFSIQVDNTVKLSEQYRWLSLYQQENGREKCIWKKKLSQIKDEYQLAMLSYKIDVEERTDKQVILQGWVLDRCQDFTITVSGINGEVIPHEIKRLIRNDVNETYHLAKDCRSGFHVLIPNDIRSRYVKIVFANAVTKQEYIADLKKILINQSKREIELEYNDYNIWMKEQKPSRRELKAQRRHKFSNKPLISVVIPLYNTPLNFLKELLDSLVGQSYQNFEVCLADGSQDDAVKLFIEKNYPKEKRIVYQRLNENLGISMNTNAAVKMATGEFIMLSDHDDVLELDALYQIVATLNEDPQIDIIYTDEDKIDLEGKKYYDPNFKSDFNIDLLRCNNYICHIFFVRKTIVDQVGLFREEFDGAQDYDFILRCTEQTKHIKHIAKVLYHWRAHPNSTAGNPASKQYAVDAGRRAIAMHYERLGMDAVVEATDVFGVYHSRYKIDGNPKVSIIIPNKDHIEDLEKCITSIIEKSTYHNYEIIIVENNSTEDTTFQYYEIIKAKYNCVKVVTWEHEFNYSKINNYGVSYAQGEYLLLLNNDVEVINEDWLEEMLGFCQREDVGIVGAKLYYPDDTVQHAGVVIGMGGIAGHIFGRFDRYAYGYCSRLRTAQDLSAVTAACLMVSAADYQAVGGLDVQFRVALNDVDFCLRVRELDKLVVFNPHVELYHYESKSRGPEDTQEKQKRFQGEIKLFRARWCELLKAGDPYYNKNLSLTRGDFSLRGKKLVYNEEVGGR